MNKVVLIGRLTKEPDARKTPQGMSVTRYTLAVDRIGKDKGADFISCICFDKTADFASLYLHKGTKIAIEGRIQTGSYTNKNGVKVYTTDVVVSSHEFCESKAAADSSAPQSTAPQSTQDEGFIDIPEGFDEPLPFS